MYIIISSIGQKGEIGKNNKLIWNFSNDLKFFKEKTLDKAIVMGRKTFESLPKVLPRRKHIVVTNDSKYTIQNDNVVIVNSIDKVLKMFENTDEEVYIIGGAKVFESFIPLCKKMYLTEIEDICSDADTYFPKFDKDEWKQTILNEYTENGLKYRIVEYSRI